MTSYIKKKEEEFDVVEFQTIQKQPERYYKRKKILRIVEVFVEKYVVFILCKLFIIFVVLYWYFLLGDSSDFLYWYPNATFNQLVPKELQKFPPAKV